MSTTDKLKELIDKCVHVDIENVTKKDMKYSLASDPHKVYYQTTEQYLEEYRDDIDSDVYDRMVESNTIIEVFVYPDTPIGFYRIFHYDLDAALTRAIKAVRHDRAES